MSQGNRRCDKCTAYDAGNSLSKIDTQTCRVDGPRVVPRLDRLDRAETVFPETFAESWCARFEAA